MSQRPPNSTRTRVFPNKRRGVGKVSKEVRPYGRNPRVFLTRYNTSNHENSSIPTPSVRGGKKAHAQRKFLPSIYNVVPSGRFRAINMVVRLRLLLRLPEHSKVVLRRGILIVRKENEIVRPRIPQHSTTMQRKALFLQHKGDSVCTPRFGGSYKEARIPLLLRQPSNKERTSTPTPSRAKFSRAHQGQPLRRRPTPQPLLRGTRLRVKAVPPIHEACGRLTTVHQGHHNQGARHHRRTRARMCYLRRP